MQVITLDPKTATYEAIAATVAGTANQPQHVQVAHKKLIVVRVCTFRGNMVRTAYTHIKSVTDFESGRVLAHYRETKDGTFRQI